MTRYGKMQVKETTMFQLLRRILEQQSHLALRKGIRCDLARVLEEVSLSLQCSSRDPYQEVVKALK